MAVGYTRQSASNIIPGVGIKAAHFNAEFNAVQAAMSHTGGHNHDGTPGGGAPIPPAGLIGLTADGLTIRKSATEFVGRLLVAPAAGLTITNPSGADGNPTFALANDLAALEALSTAGIPARTDADTWAVRSLTAPAAGLTITNPAGIAGNPTFALANDLAALEGLTAQGIAARTGSDTWTVRTLTGTANQIEIAHPQGIAGNPTFGFPATAVFPGSVETTTSLTVGNGLTVTAGTSTFNANVVVNGSLTVNGGTITNTNLTGTNITAASLAVSAQDFAGGVEGGQVELYGAQGQENISLDNYAGDGRVILNNNAKALQVVGTTKAVLIKPSGNSLFDGLRFTGTDFKYFECDSTHIAYYKKNGAESFYWRRSDNGLASGPSQVQLAELTNAGKFTAGELVSGTQITAAGAVISNGSNAGFFFQHKDNAGKSFQWYAQGNIARLWSSVTGDRLLVGEDGVVNAPIALRVAGNNVWHSGNFNPANYQPVGNYQPAGNYQTALGYTPLRDTAAGVGLAHNGSLNVELKSSGSGAAAISFHRPGSFGINFGLDTDNVLKVGGWSMGLGVAFRVLHEGIHQPFLKHGLGQYIIANYGSGPAAGIDSVWAGGGASVIATGGEYQLNNGGGGTHIGGTWVVRGKVGPVDVYLLQRTA